MSVIKEISSAAALLRLVRVLNALSAFTFTLSMASLILFIAISIQSNVSSKSFSEELLDEELDLLLEPLEDLLPEELLLDFDELFEDVLLVEEEEGLYGL